MGYKKMQSVPSIMIDYQSASLFQCLDANEKDIVWNSLMSYVDIARHKDSDNAEPFLPDGLSKIAYKVFDSMLNSVDEGFSKYWEKCEKNTEKIKKRWEKQKLGTTVYQSIPEYTKISRIENEDKKNLSNISYPSYTEQMLKSEYCEEFKNIVHRLQDENFQPTESQINDVARRMKFDLLDEKITEHCIEVCKKKNMIGMGAFFGVFNKICEGWDNVI